MARLKLVVNETASATIMSVAGKFGNFVNLRTLYKIFTMQATVQQNCRPITIHGMFQSIHFDKRYEISHTHFLGTIPDVIEYIN